MNSGSNSIGGADASTESDSSLIALLERRDEPALERLFRRHSNLVYAVAVRVLHDPAAAEDVLQEVFMQIWRTPSAYASGRASLRPLLAVISRNRAIDVLRKRRPTDSIDDVLLKSSFDLATDSEQRLLIERVKIRIAELPVEQRKALEMAFFDGMTHHEIAEKSGHPLGTVKARIRSALQTLGRAFNA
jgi:RNA polymerase sigma-70 factor (ECF subfamily)